MLDNDITELEKMNSEEFEELQQEIENETSENTDLGSDEGVETTPVTEETTEVPVDSSEDPDGRTTVDTVETTEPIDDGNVGNNGEVAGETHVPAVDPNSLTDAPTGDKDEATVETKETTNNLENIPDDYKKAKEFYDALQSAEFNANGKKVRIMMDPEKIVQMHQYGFGFHEKNKEFNKYRAIAKFAEDKGLVGNEGKLNFIGDLLDNKKEAVLKLVRDSGINIYEDYDEDKEINYEPTQHTTSREELELEAIVDEAKTAGVDENVLIGSLSNDFDPTSLEAFMSDRSARNDILKHMQDGTYQQVIDIVKEAEAYDVDGVFREQPFINKYARAYNMLRENSQKQSVETVNRQAEEEQARLEKEQQERMYTAKAKEQQQKIDEERKRAANATRNVGSSTKVNQTQQFDPFNATPGDFSDYVDKFLAGEVDL